MISPQAIAFGIAYQADEEEGNRPMPIKLLIYKKLRLRRYQSMGDEDLRRS